MSAFSVSVNDLPSLGIDRCPFDMFIDFKVNFEGIELQIVAFHFKLFYKIGMVIE